MRLLCLVATVVLLIPFDGLAAQQTPPLEPGTRVRVTAPDCDLQKQPTMIEAMRDDALVFTSDSTAECSLASVTLLEISGGRKSHAAEGAGIGFLVGAALGGLAIATAGDLDDCDPFTPTECALILGGIPAGGGLVLGTILGALYKTDRWEEVPLDRLRLSFVPKHDGLAVGFSVAL